ncbi:MAG: S1C family serine protease [Solirubrobacteraceae bacterium]
MPATRDGDEDDRVVAPGGTALALIALGVAVAGAVLALALALAFGVLHTGGAGRAAARTTTVVESAPQSVAAGGSSAVNWVAAYAQAAPGTVDVTAQTVTSANTPFGTAEEPATAEGAGFVLDGQGRILTAAHVVAGASSITVTFQDGVSRGAKVIGEDDSSDVAVLRVSPAGLTLHPLALGSSASLAVGDPVGVIGDPLGFDRSLSTGVVSALERTIEAPDGFVIPHAVQTDAALNPGNSGGPLLNAHGQVIAIADQIATGTNEFGRSSSDTSTGVGFAVPIDLARAELSQLERGERVTHAYLGVSTATTTTPTEQGALVEAVQSGTPAAKAGLRAGDVIVAFDGTTIRGASDLIGALAAAHAGEKVPLTILRSSKRVTLTVTLAVQPTQAPSR